MAGMDADGNLIHYKEWFKPCGGATPQSLKAAMSNLDNAEYFNTYGAKATRKKEVIKAIIIGGLLGALFAVIVNVIAHTL